MFASLDHVKVSREKIFYKIGLVFFAQFFYTEDRGEILTLRNSAFSFFGSASTRCVRFRLKSVSEFFCARWEKKAFANPRWKASGRIPVGRAGFEFRSPKKLRA
jgi:hypothetical protein